MKKPLTVAATTATVLLASSGLTEDDLSNYRYRHEPSKPIIRESRRIPVEVTAYSSTVDQTDSTPFITASGKRVRPGIIAVSQDLLKIMPFGTKVVVCVPKCSTYEVQDTMHPRIRRTVDIWMISRSDAIKFGRRKGTVIYEPR